jgi:site-specific DNA-adenine methylase
MSYQGGKQKLGKKIHDIISLIEADILNDENKKLDYFEPFVGFCGVIKHFNETLFDILSNDVKIFLT